MTQREQALFFDCEGESLIGILSAAGAAQVRGVLIVVGGPQYRVGSHRQFVLLARHLAERGVPTLRFDYRGMGDSTGDVRTFEQVSADIRCSIDRFFESVPTLKEIVIWGLCDAASAALFYAYRDARVTGVALVNPWVRTEQGAARVFLRHYYVRRLVQASFWQKLARGQFNFQAAATTLGKFILEAAVGSRSSSTKNKLPIVSARLPDRMEDGLRKFQGKVLLILSGNDFTAREFRDVTAASGSWSRLLDDKRVTRHDLPEANHTFSRREWRDQIARWTEAWVREF